MVMLGPPVLEETDIEITYLDTAPAEPTTIAEAVGSVKLKNYSALHTSDQPLSTWPPHRDSAAPAREILADLDNWPLPVVFFVKGMIQKEIDLRRERGDYDGN